MVRFAYLVTERILLSPVLGTGHQIAVGHNHSFLASTSLILSLITYKTGENLRVPPLISRCKARNN